jgi:hypothetical protein
MRSARIRVAAVIAAFSVAAVVPAATLGHSGGTDRRGGHHCWTRCASKGYYYGQYHCHHSPCNRSDIRRHRRHGH